MSGELGPMSRIFDGPAGEGDNEGHKTSNSVDVSDEHKCDDLGYGQRDGEVQDVRDKEAWDYETGKRRLSAVEVAKHDVSHFCVRGRAHQHGENQTIAERRLSFIGGKRAANETSVLVMVDSETDMGLAHACRKNVSGADVLEAMMADIEVLDHRQIVKSSSSSPCPSLRWSG